MNEPRLNSSMLSIASARILQNTILNSRIPYIRGNRLSSTRKSLGLKNNICATDMCETFSSKVDFKLLDKKLNDAFVLFVIISP